MQHLFSDFKPNTAADWKNQLIRDLKGEPYENLIWHNENGLEIQPFYTSEEQKQAYEPAFTHADWDICVKGKYRDAKELNKQLLHQLNSGASSIAVDIKDLDLDTALKGVQLNYIQSSFLINESNAGTLKNYLENNYTIHDLNCTLFPERMNSATDLNNWNKVIALFKEFKNIKTTVVNAIRFHNQNCLAYYEVALIMAQLAEYLEDAATKNEMPRANLVVKTGVSSDYFIQIAKLRAIRRLWNILKKEYQIENNLHLIVETSLTNKSISDSYNNLLRTTVEAMAAASGGCNELIVTEFDTLFPTNPVLSERMAVNQQLILKDESYFNKMADTACGSFYIEHITDAIAALALDCFKRFEREGGYFKCSEKGLITAEIKAQANQREELFNSQKQIAIGVNKYKNEKEKIELPESLIADLKKKPINNPVLNFELEHYFNLKHA